MLAEDLKGYDPDINADNVAEKVADCLVEIVHVSAGLIPQDELTEQKQQQLDVQLRSTTALRLRPKETTEQHPLTRE